MAHHDWRRAPVDLPEYLASGLPAETMGRGLVEDPLFFGAALAGGIVLAELCAQGEPLENVPACDEPEEPSALGGAKLGMGEPTGPPTLAAVEGPRFEQLTLDFLAYLELERGLSGNTLGAYRSDLGQLGDFLERRRVCSLDAEHSDLAAFLSELAGGGEDRPPVAAATLQRKAACLRSFYRHLRREGLIDHDPTADLRGPPKTKRLPKVLSREQVAKLVAQPKGTEPLALRDRALLEVMYACGLRVSEAIGLRARRRGPGGGHAARAREGLQGTDRAGGARGCGGAARCTAGADARARWARGWRRTCSSTIAARASRGRGSTRSSRAMRARRGSPSS